MDHIEEQVATFMQGTEYGDDSLRKTMETELKERLIECEKEGRPLRVYCGFDPRTTDLHIGHTIPMRKLRQFQEYGHEVTFLVGTYTSLVGDPSDQDKVRTQLTLEEAMENGKTYAEQAYRLLDPGKTSVRFNHEWLANLSFKELIHIASNFTIQQFLTRENFRKRWDNGDPVYLHETFYSLMQAYDAAALKTDVQVGGSDQLFNIVTAGRKLMTSMGLKPNIAVIGDILPGTDGNVKMSKSLGNHIPLNTSAEDMFGKVMSIPDHAMEKYAALATSWHAPEIQAFNKALTDGSIHPRDAKMKLAREITSVYYSGSEADTAQQAFVDLFQKGNTPDDMPVYQLEAGDTVLDVMQKAGLISSRGEGRRLVEQNGVKLDGEVLTDPNAELATAGVLQVGKRKFLELKI